MPDAKDIPPDTGKRAGVDPVTGAVHGSGVGAGGGQAGEDYSSDPETGSGPSIEDAPTSSLTPAPLPPND